MIDGTKQRKKHAINNKDRDGMLKYKPDYHDNKFTTNNELPYKEYPINNNSGYATIEKIPSASNSPMKITWQNNRQSNLQSIKQANANASLISDGIYVNEKLKYDIETGKRYKYFQNVEQEVFLKRLEDEKSKKLHFPRLNYFKPNSNSKEGYYNRSVLPTHFNDYQIQNKNAIQVEYPPDLHGIALFDQKPMTSSAFPPEKDRERLKLLNATEAWCVKNRKYLTGRGILSLTPNYEILENKHLQWVAVLAGPDESPYIHGKFKVTIILENYPTSPPRIVFNTPIFHPSIELGEDHELKIHWAHGVARFNHKLSLIAICEIVLHAMRLPETHYLPANNLNNRASNVWTKDGNLDKCSFFLEAAFYSRKYANADNMLQRELEVNLTLMEKAMNNLNIIETEHLSGAYLHFCPAYSMTKYVEKRGVIGGHKVFLSPSILEEKAKKRRKNENNKNEIALDDETINNTHTYAKDIQFSAAKKIIEQNKFARNNTYNDITPKRMKKYSNLKHRPFTAPTSVSSPLFNAGSKWTPGTRMMYSGMVKASTIAKDKKQKPSTSILLTKSLTKKQLLKVTKEQIEEYYPPSNSSSSSSSSSSDEDNDPSDLSDDEESISGYTSDVTNYNSNPLELYKTFQRVEEKDENATQERHHQYALSARTDYSLYTLSTSRSSSSNSSDASSERTMDTSRTGTTYVDDDATSYYETATDGGSSIFTTANDYNTTGESSSKGSIYYTPSASRQQSSFSSSNNNSTTVDMSMSDLSAVSTSKNSQKDVVDMNNLANMLTDMHLDGNDDIPPKPIKRNPYGFNYHSVKSLNKIKIEGKQPLHENDKSSVRTPIKPSIKSTEKDAGIPKDTNELFRTKPRDIPSYPHKFRYPINV